MILEISNFRSFKGKHVLELPNSGIFVLKGANLDTGGESGAGKSSVLMAIGSCLGINMLPQKDSQNWNSELDFQLSLKKDDLVINKGAINNIFINGSLTTGSKHIEEELCRYFDLSKDQLPF